ncbi:hypothetical protein HS041_26205 [Planomonospora sp. ID67723]|uniref:hypothetical protein n=1 Tax=Planomonospora sp. ID67723 TaxID=2738134 RepID=UPI0018C3945D|nr:hypothetical protein [Planomonospora sp. ID67723]MBG0831246.1 hypothetical protein [Planomonospora sp. ID67723]
MRRTLITAALLLSVLWPGAAQAAAVRAEAPSVPADGRVVLIGVPGLLWSDLSPEGTPNLWQLAGQSAAGSLSVRTVGRVTCPYDAWLTVSAGIRSAVGYGCGLPPVPEPVKGGAVIPDYDYLHRVAGQRGAGTLGEAVRAAGDCTLAIGPGAALALADRSGKVDHYAPSPAQVRAEALARCRVVAVDVDDLIRPYLAEDRLPRVEDALTAQQRSTALLRADAKAGAVLSVLPGDATVLLAGLSDHGAQPHLRVAMMRAGAGGQDRFLGAASTHREDVTILPDITATVLSVIGAPVPPSVVGTAWRAGESRTGGIASARAELIAADVAGQTIREIGGAFFTTVAVLQVLFYVIAFLLLRRGRGLGRVRVAAVVLASLPVATYLVNLTDWRHAGTPVLSLAGGIAGAALLLAAVALVVPFLWSAAFRFLVSRGRRGSGPRNLRSRARNVPGALRRSRPLGPLAIVTAVTAAVLAGDLLTGTTLQLNSVMGYTAVVGARYYGLGNIPFALFATSVLLLGTALAHLLARLGHRGAGVAVVMTLGCSAMILGGWPGVGSDFGGVIAFVPGIAVTALLLSGRRISVVRLGALVAAGGVTVMAIAYLDYLRPPGSQTHLGRFVGQVFTGEAMDVIGRKFGAMIGTLLSPNLMPIVIVAAAFLVYTLLRPAAASAGVLPAAFEHSPALKAGLIGTLVSGVVGMLVNDSGAAVLSMALALAVPLALSAGVAVLREREQTPYEPPGQQSASNDLVSRNS